MYGEDGVVVMTTKSRSRYTEDWVPVRGISSGTIVLRNQDKVTGVKIAPRNIFILDYESQQSVLVNLRNLYNQIDFEFWLIVADRPVDISVYMSQLHLLYNQETSPSIRKLIAEDINKCHSFINNNVVDTEYYILFKEKDPDKLQKKIRTLINSLAAAGLSAQQTSNEDMRVIMDNFLNGGKTTEFRTVVAQNG